MMRLLLSLVACMVLAATSRADAILKLSDGTTTISVADGGIGDFRAETGVVGFTGSIGVFNIQITVGTTKPAVGSATAPVLDLFNVSINSTGSGILTLEFTDHDFTTISPAMGVYANIGGTTGGTVGATVKGDDGNATFGGSTLITLGAFGPGAFSASSSSALVGFSGPYSLTLGAKIEHTGPQQVSSFDLEVTVPEPSSLAFLGSAVAILFLRRRRRA